MIDLFRIPVLTPGRIWLAFAIALAADGLQALPLPFFDQAIDFIAMICLSAVIGFHPLFLPTFVAELVPGLNLLPTWIACTTAVLALRRNQPGAKAPERDPGIPPRHDVIDV